MAGEGWATRRSRKCGSTTRRRRRAAPSLSGRSPRLDAVDQVRASVSWVAFVVFILADFISQGTNGRSPSRFRSRFSFRLPRCRLPRAPRTRRAAPGLPFPHSAVRIYSPHGQEHAAPNLASRGCSVRGRFRSLAVAGLRLPRSAAVRLSGESVVVLGRRAPLLRGTSRAAVAAPAALGVLVCPRLRLITVRTDSSLSEPDVPIWVYHPYSLWRRSDFVSGSTPRSFVCQMIWIPIQA